MCKTLERGVMHADVTLLKGVWGQVSMQMGEGGDVDALMSKMDRLQTEIDSVDGWEIDRQLERAMDALRCPPGLPAESHNPQDLVHPAARPFTLANMRQFFLQGPKIPEGVERTGGI